MLSLVLAGLRSLAAGFHARRNLVLENLALRHQLLELNRTVKSPALRNSDRIFWAAVRAIWSRVDKGVARRGEGQNEPLRPKDQREP